MIPKFRVWCKNRKEWEKDICFISQDGMMYQRYPSSPVPMPILTKNHDVLQSTGLKDKNGVEIYEGDIVKVSVHNGFDYYDNEVCVVRKSRFHSGLVCINSNNDMECRIFNQGVLEDYQYEVIGNIYEDKELLEVEG